MSERDDPGPGGMCDDCGHFAGRHHSGGCDTSDLVAAGIRSRSCPCGGFLWLGARYASGRDIYAGVPARVRGGDMSRTPAAWKTNVFGYVPITDGALRARWWADSRDCDHHTNSNACGVCDFDGYYRANYAPEESR